MRLAPCIAFNCEGTHSLRHYLPQNLALRNKWLQALNRNDLIDIPYTKAKNLKVCGAHFIPANYRTAESSLLNRNTIPIKIDPPAPQQSVDVTLSTDMPRKQVCVAKDCDCPMKPFHSLPRCKELSDKWLHNLGRDDLVEVNCSTSIHRLVCSKHFEPSQYNYPGCVRLLRNALPRPLQPNNSAETSTNDPIDDLIKDAPIATGEVTAPLLCDNKVLLKTKSTYSKNKYKMTFEEVNDKSPKNTEDTTGKPKLFNTDQPTQDLPLVISNVFQESDSDDENHTYNISPSTVKPLTPTKRKRNKVKTKYESILKNNLNNKKRKYNESDTEIDLQEEMYANKYDDQLFSVLNEVKSLPGFLDIIFGFLYRRTDYFQISTEQNLGVGLPNGVAQKLLWQAFKKYENKHRDQEDVRSTKKEEIFEKPVKCDVNKIVVEKSASSKEKEKITDAQIFDTYNGAVFDNYAWSQSITDVDVQIKIPDKITCKQLQIDITSSQLLIKLNDSETVYLKGELCKKCKMNETVWSLGGHILQIHLEKQCESWWDCLLKAEPRLDFNKMDCSRPFHKLSEETRLKIEQHNSKQISLEEPIDIVWENEESPFIEEYDPLIETAGS